MKISKKHLQAIRERAGTQQTAEAMLADIMALFAHIDALEAGEPDPSNWMTRNGVAEMLQCHVDSVDRGRVPYSDKAPPPGKWRYKLLQLGKTRFPRIYRPDVENAFLTPGVSRGA